MKKLVTDKSVKALLAEGKTVLYIDEDTLLTPSAKDWIRNSGVSVVKLSEGQSPPAEGCSPCTAQPEQEAAAQTQACCQGGEAASCCADPADRERIVEAIIEVLKKRGILDKILD